MDRYLLYILGLLAVFFGVIFVRRAIIDFVRHQPKNYVKLFRARFDCTKLYIKRFLLDEPKHLQVYQCLRGSECYVYEHRCSRKDFAKYQSHPEKLHLSCTVYEHRADKLDHLFVPDGKTPEAVCWRDNVKPIALAVLGSAMIVLGVVKFL